MGHSSKAVMFRTCIYIISIMLWDLNRLNCFETGQKPFVKHKDNGVPYNWWNQSRNSTAFTNRHKLSMFRNVRCLETQGRAGQGRAHQQEISPLHPRSGWETLESSKGQIAHSWCWQVSTRINSAVTSVALLVWARAHVWQQGYTVWPWNKQNDILHLFSIFYLRFSDSGTYSTPIIINHLAPGNKTTADTSSLHLLWAACY